MIPVMGAEEGTRGPVMHCEDRHNVEGIGW